MFPDDDEIQEAVKSHEGHNVAWCTAGAPGIGNSIWCFDCKVTVWSNIRVMEPHETR